MSMRSELQPIDISDIPELASLAEEVRTTGTSRLLKRGDQEIAVLSPVEKGPRRQRARRRATVIPRSDSLFDLIGLVRTQVPGDVAENKHKYLAEAYYAESHPPQER